MIDIAPIS